MIDQIQNFKNLYSVDDDCAICLEKLNDPIILKCQVHKFCRSCLLDNFLVSNFCPMCRTKFEICDLKDIQGKPLMNSIWNQIYIQANQIGLASYHFDHNKPYISYQNIPENWKLDSGNAPPLKKYFENVQYDPINRVFQGIINWQNDTFNGDTQWEYTLMFSQNYNKIEQGQVKAHHLDNTIKIHNYEQDLFYKLEIQNLVETLKNPIAALRLLQ